MMRDIRDPTVSSFEESQREARRREYNKIGRDLTPLLSDKNPRSDSYRY